MEHSYTEIFIFITTILIFLWIDLYSHKDNKAISIKNSIVWSLIWIILAFIFAIYLAYTFDVVQAELFITGYLLEKTLSIDNLFVIMAIFKSFSIKDELQHRVLYYGILGALVMRLLFIAIGTSLISTFGAYALTVFGVLILWTAWKMWQTRNTKHTESKNYSNHWAIKYISRIIPVSTHLHGQNFFIKTQNNGNKTWQATPLFLCLIVIEMSDVMFAFDSIPAILAITHDPFLIYTSNIFAILGLRSLYFMLSAAKRYLKNLEVSVIIILAYVGIKMILAATNITHISPIISLFVVIISLSIGVITSIYSFNKKTHY